MASATPGASATIPQTKHDSQNAGTPNADFAMNSIPRDQFRAIAEHIQNPGTGHEHGGASVQSSVKGDERRCWNGVNLQRDKDSADKPTTERPPADIPEISPEMDKYRRMEAFLLKHRKEWESSNSPVLEAELQRTYHSRFLRGLSGLGPWNVGWGFTTEPPYQRLNPFELTIEHGAFTLPQGTEEKDDFDTAIDYSAARNRLRKSFDGDLDRLFLLEGIASRKQK